MDRLDNWKRFAVTIAGLLLILVGSWARHLDTGAVAVIVTAYVTGASVVKATANVSPKKRR